MIGNQKGERDFFYRMRTEAQLGFFSLIDCATGILLLIISSNGGEELKTEAAEERDFTLEM